MYFLHFKFQRHVTVQYAHRMIQQVNTGIKTKKIGRQPRYAVNCIAMRRIQALLILC